MQLDIRNTAAHLWITAFWCALGAVVLGAIAVISCWIRKCRPNVKYQYTALDSGNGIQDRSPKERAARDRSLTACQEWVQNSNGRYDIIAHLDEIGSRHNKHWFLINDASVRTDRLMTLLPIPPDCVALQEELPPSESPKGLLMQLLGSLHHPYVYPVLDLGFLHTESISYACLVMPFNPRGSLRDLIYKAQWNEPYNRKYSRKSSGLPLTQIQRLGRQILEALLFLKERGFPLHGHLHSGNVILQNGVARLSGLENGLLGLHSRINAVLWSRSTNEIENIDILCFGYLLYEMCLGDELNTPNPTAQVLEMELERHPQILETLILIFDPPDGCCPTVEELVLCDLFRNIDLRELRGPCVSTIKPSFNKSTLSLLQAVKKRQTASLGGSFSETSSPCTPPSTPRDRRAGTADSFDISSDSDASLDEVVITSSSYDSHHYDPLSSPIHFCDNSLQSDDNSSAITTSALVSQVCEEAESSTSTSASTSTCSNNQLTTDMCNFNNSKSRRMEYSLRCMKYGRSNPSQDSAFGSLTDGELSIASSSFRLSSFQSITSPIDEGVEDTILSCSREANLEPTKSPGQNDSAISTPCRENSPCFGGDNDVVERGVMKNAGCAAVGSLGNKSPFSPSASPRKHPTTVHLNPNQAFDPPKILLNDQSSIYTTSPSKKSGTIEVFSQKYRVSSFEDMSPNKKNLRNVNKLAFRSLEEEQRIDNAFVPIKDRTNSENRVYSINKNEKYKKLTHTSFAHRITAGNRDRYTMWRDSTFYRKTKIAKSNDSLLDSPKSRFAIADSDELKKGLNRGNSVAEISCSSIDCKDLASLKIDSRKSRSERHIFNLSKLKQTAINDFVSVDEFIQDNKSLSLGSTSFTQITLFKNLEEGSESNADSSEEHSPLHQDMCKYIGNTGDPSEEKTPLLENMEMSPISPTEPNETL